MCLRTETDNRRIVLRKPKMDQDFHTSYVLICSVAKDKSATINAAIAPQNLLAVPNPPVWKLSLAFELLLSA